MFLWHVPLHLPKQHCFSLTFLALNSPLVLPPDLARESHSLAIIHRAILPDTTTEAGLPWTFASLLLLNLAWRLQCRRQPQPFLTVLSSSTRRVPGVTALLLGPPIFHSKRQLFFYFTHDGFPHKSNPLNQGQCVTIKLFNVDLHKADFLHQCQKLSLSFWGSLHQTTLPEKKVCYGIPHLQLIILPCGSIGIFHPLTLPAVSVGSITY